MSTEIQRPIITEHDLSQVDNALLNSKQLQFILKKTPAKYIKKRPAKGGGEWSFVSGNYVQKCLNLMFGWDWDFEVTDDKITPHQVIVKGRLTCRINGRTIVKTQYGRKDIICRKGTDTPLDLGNDLKAAATDALKKCASQIGIAADVYSDEFNEIAVTDSSDLLPEITELYELKKDGLSAQQQADCERIISGKESKSYSKLLNLLKTA